MSATQIAPTTTRIHPRYSTYFDAVLESGCVRSDGTVLSLSEQGLFVATGLRLSPGTRITTTFRIPDVGRLRMPGTVAYQAVAQDHEGLGIRILSDRAGADAVSAIRRWHEEYRIGG